jgi:ankyrin repeat protein
MLNSIGEKTVQMIQPPELKLDLPVKLSNDVISTTKDVWDILWASVHGDLSGVKGMVDKCPELAYAQFNYTPPIHFAVREGHTELVEYLLDNGAHDPSYKTYPFLDKLSTVAHDRGYDEIEELLIKYENDPSLCKYKGDNGEILFDINNDKKEFQRSVNHNENDKAKEILQQHPEFAKDNSLSWYEGVLMMPSNRQNKELLELLLNYGATVPTLSKWGRAYYFKHFEIANFLLQNGMDPNHITWHHVTLLHDMAQEGDVSKAKLLVEAGAELDSIEEEYQSTPLGMAARWGHMEMVRFLIDRGAHVNKSGADWSTPLSWARRKGHEEIENILVRVGAN